MRISGRNWFTAFAIAVLVHAGITFGWLFLSSNPQTQATEENTVRVSLRQWEHTLSVDSRGMVTAPEVPVVQEVIPSAASSVSIESSVLSEVVGGVHVHQPRHTDVDEAVNVLLNEDMLSEEVEYEESTEVSNLTDSVFDVAVAVKSASTEELPVRAEPVDPEQLDMEQPESARISTLEKSVPSINKEQDPLLKEEALGRAVDRPSLDQSAKQEESENDSTLSQQESIGQELTALPQGEVSPAINEEGNSALHQEYLQVLMSKISAQKRYPSAARLRGVTGAAKVRFVILADGSMESSELVESSGNRHLDREALGMLSRARPFPPIPKSLQKNQIDLQVPIVFELN